MRRPALHHGPPSDHFDGRRFFNPSGPSHPPLRVSLRWLATRRRAAWPRTVEVAPAMPDAAVADLRVTFVGHATVLVQAPGLNVLLDPVWSERVGPRGIGPRRHHAPGIRFVDLPKIDLVVVTHAHWDHMDAPTLARLRDGHAPRVVAPLGCDAVLAREVPGLRVETLDWHGTADGVTALPCRHWSERWGGDRDLTLWASFLIDTPAGPVFLMGDTGYDGGRPYDLPARPRLAAIPIGAYAPRWHMEHEHQDPDDAVRGFLRCGADHAVGIHWGCFRMTDEAREDPPAALAAAKAAHGVAPDRFRALRPGEAWDVPP
ncbi:MBL fold metallo-hydrolase [Jannaschia sp. Os4]|uniref:MBL fold metallo-hydrolase n=1 Tax=Jannaschia sp. Os4 TaxID=2807617 RepID=UPI00193A929F|nr:MBL fold metallo-hydrolase [Jannaschia sp. Os4]MBM2577943.1 MBL fold metallo-hydrolase [Jannaschia sp. Os4]